MKAYVVRLNGEQSHPHELVGFYVAKSIPQLYDLIDECCDVDRVEIRELKAGGIYWDDKIEFVVPPPDLGEEVDPPPLPAVSPSLCDGWYVDVHDEAEEMWEATDVAAWSPELDQLYTQLKKFEVSP